MRVQDHAPALALALAALASACGGDPAPAPRDPWAFPFAAEADVGCRRIVRVFSVENPWDHAHEGVDFGCPEGTPVLAAAAGVVERVEARRVGSVERVRMDLAVEGGRYRLEYINLTAAAVEAGQVVGQGDVLGWSALGLHLGVWDVEAGRFIDPLGLLEGPDGPEAGDGGVVR